MALYDWAHVGKDKKIEIDLGTYWDLSDDAIAYTVAHEMGHIVLDGRGIHKFGKSWDTPALKRAKVQSELDADAYGAEIAFKSGYSPKRAFDQMNAEAKSWRYNPNVKGQDFYPDYPMRQKSLDQTIQRLKSELDAAKQGNDAQAAQQELNSLRQQQSQQQSTSQPQNDQQLAAAKQAIFNHIFRGIGTLSA